MLKLTLLFVVCLVFSASAQQKWDTLPNLQEHYRARVAQFKKEKVVTGRIIVLGNSITEGGQWKKLLNDTTVVNRGIGGDVTFGVLARLADITNRKPSVVMLMIGINDLSKGIPDEVIIENIFSIATKIKKGSPDTKVIIESILPLNPTFKNFPKGYDKNEHVVVINEQLQKYADRLGYTYVDMYSEMLDQKGKLNTLYSTDGLHLGPAGYQHWADVLKKLKVL